MNHVSTILRPLGMGELFDRAIRLYRRNFWRFVGVLAVMQIPVVGLNLVTNLLTYDATLDALPTPAEIAGESNPFALLGPDYYSGVFINLLVTVVYLVLVSGIASAALTRLAADAYLDAQAPSGSLLGAYAAIGDRWGPLVRAIAVYILLILAGLIWTLIPCIGWFTGPGMMVVMAGMVLPLVAPVVVLENHGARESIRRSWELVRGRFWWVFGFMVLLYLFNWVVVGGPSLLTGFALGFVLPEQLASDNPELLNNIQVTVQAVVNMVFNLLYLPLQLSCLTLLYFDLRVRQEGLDLALAASTGTGFAKPIRDKVAESAPSPQGPLFQGREWTYFAALTGSILGLYLLVVFGLTFIILAASGL